MSERLWLTMKQYAETYGLTRPLVYKFAHFELVTLKRITIPGQTKPVVRVENIPPRERAFSAPRTPPLNTRPSRPHQGVYFIQCGTFIKIGLAQDVRDRLTCLRGNSPHDLVPLAWIPTDDPRSLERELHWTFYEHAHLREWFCDHPDIRAYISAHAQAWPT